MKLTPPQATRERIGNPQVNDLFVEFGVVAVILEVGPKWVLVGKTLERRSEWMTRTELDDWLSYKVKDLGYWADFCGNRPTSAYCNRSLYREVPHPDCWATEGEASAMARGWRFWSVGGP
jgi:hypothetical protein